MSAVVPDDDYECVLPGDFSLPLDPSPAISPMEFVSWDLDPVTYEHFADDASSTSQYELESHVATLTFSAPASSTATHLTLKYDVQFVASFPCTPPATRSPSRRTARIPILRRNSHGFEPLLSHPPDSPATAPIPIHTHVPDDDLDQENNITGSRPELMKAHPLHVSYKYKIVSATYVLDAAFSLPFKHPQHLSPLSSGTGLNEKLSEPEEYQNTILILDARGSHEVQLLARAWCAEQGLHAIIGRVGRTCIACCVREARGLGINIVIRV